MERPSFVTDAPLASVFLALPGQLRHQATFTWLFAVLVLRLCLSSGCCLWLCLTRCRLLGLCRRLALRLYRHFVRNGLKLQALATFGLLFDGNLDGTAFLELAEQHLFRQRLLDVLLDHAAERSCAHTFVIPLLCEPGDGILRQIEGDVAFGKLCLELHDELLHDLMHHWRRQSAKRNDGIQAVTELRREQPVDRLHIVAFALR